jgi:predicted nuclease of predicted toxin-antitoxin system
MAKLYADENFPYAVVDALRALGHDVLTVQEAGQQGGGDADVLHYGTAAGRAVLTLNRRHFIRLHSKVPAHAGIIVCSKDDPMLLAGRINQILVANPVLHGLLFRVNRPP